MILEPQKDRDSMLSQEDKKRIEILRETKELLGMIKMLIAPFLSVKIVPE